MRKNSNGTLVTLCLYSVAAGLILIAASLLGTPWLTAKVLGTPIGLWLALTGGIAILWHARGRPSITPAFRLVALRKRLFDTIEDSRRRRSTDHAAPPVSPRQAKRALAEQVIHRSDGLVGSLARTALRCIPDCPLRIGVAGIDLAALPSRFPGDINVRFIHVNPRDDRTSQEVIAADRLDAYVHAEQPSLSPSLFADIGAMDDSSDRKHTIYIVTAQAEHKPGALLDYGQPLPATMMHVFSPRADAGETILPGVDLANQTHARAVFDLAVALAALSRSPHRLTLDDLFTGRQPYAPAKLTHTIGSLLRSKATGPAHTACARLVTTWFGLTGQTGDIGPWVRAVTDATDRLRDEPAAMLQRGAVFVFDSQYNEATRAFVDAALLLRTQHIPSETQLERWLQEELEATRQYDPAAAGRVAAAVTLALAAADRDVRRYVRQDLADDLARTEWIDDCDGLRPWFAQLIERIMQLPKDVQLVKAA
ncbi:MAG: hypothetical protein KAS72_02420 [Phycisphaerales bacterium]|nr:hypothetical protein [Phycisphaerales bacterium]